MRSEYVPLCLIIQLFVPEIDHCSIATITSMFLDQRAQKKLSSIPSIHSLLGPFILYATSYP